jgi:hypothetical protein
MGVDETILFGIFTLAAGLSVALVNAYFELKRRRDDREEQAKAHWRDAGATAVGNLQIFVDDSSPDDVLETPWLGDGTVCGHIGVLVDRWRTVLREPLRTFGVGHPSSEIRSYRTKRSRRPCPCWGPWKASAESMKTRNSQKGSERSQRSCMETRKPC